MSNQLEEIVLSHYVSTVPFVLSQTFWFFGMFLSYYTMYNQLHFTEYS